jgi:hypothetical protein
MTDAPNMTRKAGKFQDQCFEIQLDDSDLERFKIDNTDVLLELRPHNNRYGVFYTARGQQWDVWSDPDGVESPDKPRRNVDYAMQDPVAAAVELLGQEWRPDYLYDPEENA